MNAVLAVVLLLVLMMLIFYAYLSGPRQQRPGAIITYGFDSRDPRPTHTVDPIYPRKAYKKGIQGYVIVRLVIDEDGSVTKAEVLKSQPRGTFNRAVSHAVKQWKFSSGQWRGGRKYMFVRIRFGLRGDESFGTNVLKGFSGY